MESKVINEALAVIAEQASTAEDRNVAMNDAANVLTGIGRGAGCAQRPRFFSVNCGRVCSPLVRLCQVTESVSPLQEPVVSATKDASVRDKNPGFVRIH